MGVSVILACAGKGERAGFNKNKLLVKNGGITAIERVYSAFSSVKEINQIIVTASPVDEQEIIALLGKNVVLSKGGKTRTESIKHALCLVTEDIVVIHDGARPFVTERIILDCINSAKEKGGVITVLPSRNTVCNVKENGAVNKYLGKDEIFSVQTPQAFKTELIKKAYSMIGDSVYNDDGEIYQKFIGELYLVKGDAKNVKITYAEDIKLLEKEISVKFGVGFDCHRLVENRKLILGGVAIPHDKGLLGHSDADVLTHAIMDAILSSLSEHDIGYHFPDTDEKYKDANSILLLEKVLEIANVKGYKVSQVTATIMAEKPKLKTHIPAITKNLAKVLNINETLVGIGATTLEGLGFVGHEEGICVHATATLTKI